jgi:hypothetical protein
VSSLITMRIAPLGGWAAAGRCASRQVPATYGSQARVRVAMTPPACPLHFCVRHVSVDTPEIARALRTTTSIPDRDEHTIRGASRLLERSR